MAKPPWFPLYVNDFLSDPAVKRMSKKEIGWYVLAMCHAWQEDEPGTLPSDIRHLSSILNAKRSQIERIFGGILGTKWPIINGRRVNKKLMQVAEEQRERSEKNKLAGQLGGLATAAAKSQPSKSKSKEKKENVEKKESSAGAASLRTPPASPFKLEFPENSKGKTAMDAGQSAHEQVDAWPDDWAPIRKVLKDAPVLARSLGFICDLEFWQAQDEALGSCPVELDELLRRTAAYLVSADYKPIGITEPKRRANFRLKLKNCLTKQAEIAVREAKRR